MRASREERERVCVHVYPPALEIPGALLGPDGSVPEVRPRNLLDSGLPEFFLCATGVSFRDLFPYFWPPLEAEFKRLEGSMELLFSIGKLSGPLDAAAIERRLADIPAPPPGKLVVAAFTYNEFTRFLSGRLLRAARSSRVSETVIFKDPTVAPYLCDFPAVQRKFRRSPG
jgi:hypothetical protein